MNVEQAVRTRIAGLSAVVALVGARVWLEKLPESPTYPTVLVQLISDVPDQHLRGPVGTVQARVQVDAIGKDSGDGYATVATLEGAIYGDGLGRNASGLFGWIGGIGSPPFQILNVAADVRRVVYDPEEIRTFKMTRDYFVTYRT